MATVAETVAWAIDNADRARDALEARGLPVEGGREAMLRAYEAAVATEYVTPPGAQHDAWRAYSDRLRSSLGEGFVGKPPAPPEIDDARVIGEFAKQRAGRGRP